MSKVTRTTERIAASELSKGDIVYVYSPFYDEDPEYMIVKEVNIDRDGEIEVTFGYETRFYRPDHFVDVKLRERK